jgi:putative ABC transport system permease protein
MTPAAWLVRARDAIRLVTGFVHRRSQDSALDEEMQFHIDRATERNIRRGMSAEEARRQALVTLGGRAQWTEATRDEQRSRVLEDFVRDLRYGAAALRRNIGFAVGGVTTIALAIAATTTVFNFVSAVYLRSLAVPEGPRLVRIHAAVPPTRESTLGFPAFVRLREHTRSLDLVAAHYSTAPLYVHARGESGEVPSAVVSADYFRMLGIRPALGRFFAPAEDSVPDRDAVAVIGYGLWRSRFGADSQVVGERISINGRPFTVIGVAPPEFDGVGGGLVNALWIPMMMLRTGYRWCDGFDPSCAITSILARLAPGVTLLEAQAELDVLRATLLAGRDSADAEQGIIVEPARGIRDQEQHQYAKLSALLWAIAIVLMLVASANLGGLLLARGMARRREFALRSSLGASRWRIVRQLLAEGLILGVAGGAVGVMLSLVTSRALAGFFATEQRRLTMPLDSRVLAFGVGVSLTIVLLFSLFPALRVSRVDVSEALKTGGNRSSNHARSVLVAGQAVLAVALLIAAGLLSRSFERAMSGGGFDPTHVAQVRLRPRLVGYSPDRAQAYVHKALDNVRAVPGVVVAAPARGSLDVLSTGVGSAAVALPGEAPMAGDRAPRVDYFDVGPGFFATLRVPIAAGREFSKHDTPSTPLVALVNESLAKRLWGSINALDRSLVLDGKAFQVVGVVKDYHPHPFGESPHAAAYVAYWQNAFGPQVDANVAIRVEGDPLRALAPIRRAIESADPSVPVTEGSSMERTMRSSYAEVRLGGIVLIASAALTLFLAAVGLYGVVSYLATQRAKEIAVRLAVGARPGDVVAMLLRQGLRPIGVGGAIGLIVSVAAAPLLSRWLFGIAPVDGATILAALAAVTAVALIASYVPARRGASTDPAAVFRSD